MGGRSQRGRGRGRAARLQTPVGDGLGYGGCSRPDRSLIPPSTTRLNRSSHKQLGKFSHSEGKSSEIACINEESLRFVLLDEFLAGFFFYLLFYVIFLLKVKSGLISMQSMHFGIVLVTTARLFFFLQKSKTNSDGHPKKSVANK